MVLLCARDLLVTMELVGCTYEGDMVDNIQHGTGRMTFANGNVYEGGFHKGQFHGEGVLHLAKGGRYEGSWNYGKEVSGNMVFDDELKYEETDWKYVCLLVAMP